MDNKKLTELLESIPPPEPAPEAPEPAEEPTTGPAGTGPQPQGWPDYLRLLREAAEETVETAAERINMGYEPESVLALAQAQAALYQGAATHYLALTQAEEQDSTGR